jgi:hypothetical protein
VITGLLSRQRRNGSVHRKVLEVVMALVRVDYAALAAVASHLQPLPQRLAAAHQEIVAARASAGHVGDPAAAANTDELLRQLAWLVDMGVQATAGLTRALTAASTDYATAENVVVRFD